MWDAKEQLDEVSNLAGWDMQSELLQCLRFIDEQALTTEFRSFLEAQYDEELEMSEEVIDWEEIYEDAECPDCGDPIPARTQSGDNCENCGHTFWTHGDSDDDEEENYPLVRLEPNPTDLWLNQHLGTVAVIVVIILALISAFF